MEIGYIKPRRIIEEMQESYLDYAMSVIISRALPDVRDGLKPVHRRILYAMWNTGVRAGTKYRKSAAVVGEVLGKYHPHGDIAVYDSMVRMAQDFAMRYPLIDGQGNWGSIDGDSAAAMRYTECRLSKISEELLFDLEKETVNFIDNYDKTQREPVVLPAKLPNLLLNGTMGIAVGMTTNIPPHNLGEIVDATCHLIDHPKTAIEDLTKFVKGPDFPTGGLIFNKKEILRTYATGRGAIVMRGRAEIVETKKGQFSIIISEIPYQVNKATLVTKIADLVKAKKLEGIKDIRDESSKEGIRINIELKREAYPKKILNRLYALTSLQDKYHVILLSLVEGIQPRVLTLKEILGHYIRHRQEVVERKTRYDLKIAKERAHILEGLKIALDHLDEVIRLIKKSKTREEAHKNLIKKFKLDDIQAKAILDIRLHQLARLERKKIEDELKEKKKLIKELETILKSPKKILKIIKEELLALKKKYGDERRTKVIASPVGEFKPEELIPEENVAITLTKGGYIKSLAESIYKAQARGGKGVIGMATREEDVVEHFFVTSSHSDILFFTNTGKVFQLKAYEVPKSTRAARGQSIVNFLSLGPDEKVTAVIPLGPKERPKIKFLVMVTRKGLVKKVKIEDFTKVRRSGLIALKLKKDDTLGWVHHTSGKDEIMIITAKGQAIRFKEADIRPMGRVARGVRGIRLKRDDEAVGMATINAKLKMQNAKLLIITENGHGKQTELRYYKRQKRGGSGIKTAKVTKKTGNIVTAKVITPDIEEIIVISKKGQVIRTKIKDISVMGRATQGVKVMRLTASDTVASVAYV